MNQREFQALGASELDPMAVVLYVRVFRSRVSAEHPDVTTTRYELERAMEFQPGSEGYLRRVHRVTWKRVMELERALILAGLLELLHIDGDRRMYRCLLISDRGHE
ncbi:hypothetical protein [Aliidiomarina maris]|uniref:Uncharacterized protein n=1 Tax=Aliidiomarina maris TaxID=531312 RepID=A0A327XBK1_9GAMM|nr:hypothetical protein [Aliidiomarina maris]RAK01626.1 hypothetical protein B0I24_101249 [Aliidiomarina maris]RUO28451.1 hypothetical protein CWE07_01190 [Aliidiomarina maris]